MIDEAKAEGVKQIAVDITGGKTPMSIGMFLAAEEEKIDSLYVSAKYDKGGAISDSINAILLSSSNHVVQPNA
jgi:hypothetical protein